MVVMLSGRETSCSFLQLSKAALPIFFRPSGRKMADRLLQPAKVCSPIEVTESGIVSSVMASHLENAVLPMVVTVLGISNLPENACQQPAKALSPMVVRFVGRLMTSREKQPAKV